MHNFLISFLLLSLLLNTGCASKGSSQPDWVNGNSEKYPATKYLSGKGEDSHQAVARDRARADLAKVFEVRIQEQSADNISSSSQTENGKTNMKLEASTSRDISTRTDQIISGIEIAETWKDETSKQFHVLAVLERMKASKNLREAISQLDDVTAHAIKRAQQSNNLLQKIGLAQAALQAQLEREIYNKQLKVADYSGLGRNSSYNLASLASDRDSLLQRMSIYSKVSADPIGGLDDILKAGLSNAGFSHVNSDNADYILSAKLLLNETKDAQGWYWQRGTLEINLDQAANKQAQGSQRWNIKESAQDPAVAKKRVRDKMNKILKTELRSTLIGFGSTE